MKLNEAWKVVVWGHPLHSNTYSYIHAAFVKAFSHLGINVFWHNDLESNFDYKNTIFLTEGQVDKTMPLRDDCFYILHNCDNEKYAELIKNKRAIRLQVYTNDVIQHGAQEISKFLHYDVEGQVIYQTWGSDLLPCEIEENKKNIIINNNSNVINWVGSIGAGKFGNINELTPFINAAKENNINFNHITGLSEGDIQKTIKASCMAPTIAGSWQVEKSYIPCRIFKNISYGMFGITNSAAINELFKNKLIYNPNTYQLFYDAKKTLSQITTEQVQDLMNEVSEKHTFLNRIKSIFNFMCLVNPSLSADIFYEI